MKNNIKIIINNKNTFIFLLLILAIFTIFITKKNPEKTLIKKTSPQLAYAYSNSVFDYSCLPSGGKLAFYTGKFRGKIEVGGLIGQKAANLFCQRVCESAGINKTCKAFLSTNSKNAATNITPTTNPSGYYMIEPGEPAYFDPFNFSITSICHRTTISTGGLGNLLDGNIDNHIDKSIAGGPTGWGSAWTGSTSGGAYTGSSCYRFTSSSGIDLGTIGKNSYTDWRWAEYESNYCYQRRGIYCFQID